LDEPLRDDERLFAPKTYSHPFAQGATTSDIGHFKLSSGGKRGLAEDGTGGTKRKGKKKLKSKKSLENTEYAQILFRQFRHR